VTDHGLFSHTSSPSLCNSSRHKGKNVLYIISHDLPSDTQMIRTNFWVLRILGLLWDRNQRQTGAAKVRKILFVVKRRERLHGGMQQDPETGGPMGQVGNSFLAFFLIGWGQRYLSDANRRFLGRRSVSPANYNLLGIHGPPAVHPSFPSLWNNLGQIF
jgi:hypothetical protein